MTLYVWHINLENTSSFSYYFPVNVLRKEITFEKASTVIKVCLATDNADTSTPTSKPRRTGRKRSGAKVEDEELVKRIKRGQDFERNERQRKDLEEMNKGAGESFRRLAWGGAISISVVILIAWAVGIIWPAVWSLLAR